MKRPDPEYLVTLNEQTREWMEQLEADRDRLAAAHADDRRTIDALCEDGKRLAAELAAALPDHEVLEIMRRYHIGVIYVFGLATAGVPDGWYGDFGMADREGPYADPAEAVRAAAKSEGDAKRRKTMQTERYPNGDLVQRIISAPTEEELVETCPKCGVQVCWSRKAAEDCDGYAEYLCGSELWEGQFSQSDSCRLRQLTRQRDQAWLACAKAAEVVDDPCQCAFALTGSYNLEDIDEWNVVVAAEGGGTCD